MTDASTNEIHLHTRRTSPKTFTEILLGGLAPDGGLYCPKPIRSDARRTGCLARCPMPTWPSRCCRQVRRRHSAEATLKRSSSKTYTPEVYRSTPRTDTAQITPLRTLEPGLHMLELSNGPTLAFKDMAMQLLGNLFEYVLDKKHAN